MVPAGGTSRARDENTWTVLESEADLAGLPASVIEAAKASAAERKIEGRWRKEILIIEDDLGSRRALTNVLQDRGYAVP